MSLNKFKKLPWLLFLLILTLPALWNLLKSGFFVTDDGGWMVIRFSAFHQELANGQFPVRWLNRLNNGYGYPVAAFLYPGFMYLAEIPKILGFGFVDSVKVVFMLSVFSAAIFAFLWLKKIFGTKAAFLGSLAYIYSPYFLWDIYKRGSVGEILALSIIPFVAWSLVRRRYTFTILGYALLILAHNTLALLFIPLLFLYQCINSLKQKQIRSIEGVLELSLPLLLGFGLSAFFWLPAIFELKYTVFGEVVVSSWQDHFLKLKNLLLLGGFNLIIFGAAGLVLLQKRHSRCVIAISVWSLFLLGIFLALPASSFLWRAFPLGKFIQFPFRFLSWEVLANSYLAAFVVSRISKKWQSLVVAVTVSTVIVVGVPFSQPEEFVNKPDSYYATNEATTTVQDEYMPRWVEIKPEKRAEKEIERIDDETVQINTIYWPGWKVYVDGEERKVDYDNEMGVMRVKVSAGEHEIKPVFSETPLRLLADFVSLVSLLFLGFIFYRQRVVARKDNV